MRSIIFFTVLFFIGATALGQSADNIPKSFVPPSPNAANLGLYTSVPVDPYTGVPGISVPIHTIKINGLDLNVNLSYHAGGVRYSDEGAWVGLGWSLNAGGIVGRTKRDKDDFSQNGFYKINPSGRPCDGSYDQEPDLFYFNFAGHSGKFVLDYNNGSTVPKVKTLVKDGLVIATSLSNGWRITDENGTIYEFELKENTTDVFTGGGITESEVYVSSWYLTKIVNSFGESIVFSYNNTGNKIKRTIKSGSSTNLTFSYPSYLFATYTEIDGMTGADYYAQLPKSYSSSSSNEISTDEIVLSQITSNYDLLEFVTSDRTDLLMQNTGMPAKKLDKILLKSIGYLGRSYSETIKSFNFTYDYFDSQSGQPNHISKRLQLKSMSTVSGSANISPYEFFYTTNVLPDKQSMGGFLPQIADGLLNKLIYPTGGYTTFEYEAHFGYKGARIKKVSQTDFTGTYNTRYFEYIGGKQLGFTSPFAQTITTTGVTATMNGSTFGGVISWTTNYHIDQQMMSESSSSYLIGYDQVVEYYGATGEFGKTIYTYFNEAAPAAIVVPADVSNGNGFLLSKEDFAYTGNSINPYIPVQKTERQINVVNQLLVQCRRRVMGTCNYSYQVKSDWVRAANETETKYDQYGSNPVAKTITYTYGNPNHIYPTSEQFIDSKNASWTVNNKYTPDKSAEAGGVYTVMNQQNIIKKLETTVIRNGAQISKTKTNYRDWYSDGGFIVPESEEFQKGSESAEIRTRYHSYSAQGRPTELSKEDDIRVKYIWGYRSILPIAEIKQVNIADYTKLITETRPGTSSPVPSGEMISMAEFDLDHAQTITLSGTLTRNSGNLNELRSFHVYVKDYYNNGTWFSQPYWPNATINETVSLPRGKFVLYYSFLGMNDWEPDLSLSLNVSITYKKNLVLPSCFYSSFEEADPYSYAALTGVNVHLGLFKVPLPGISGKYKLSYWEKPATSGNWEFNQQIITINGPDASPLFIGASGKIIDEVRLHPIDALMTTYTYDPQKGMTSKNDEKNQITYYEYDELGRLKVILDHQRNILKTFTYKYQEDQQ